jgi:cyclophilin family peptidyl-prolyl cis-trans isomerase/HEAT repeat protein
MKHWIWIVFVSVALSQCMPPQEEVITEVHSDLADSVMQQILDVRDRQNTTDLLPFFSHQNPAYRQAAAMAFASHQDTLAIDSLVQLLEDPVEEVRIAAAFSLGQIGSPRVDALLLRAFERYDTMRAWDGFNAAVLEAIGRSGTEDHLKDIATVTSYQLSDTSLLAGQAWAVYRYALRGITHPEGTRRMVEIVANPEFPSAARFPAANYLYRAAGINLENYADPLIEAFRAESDPNVRMFLAIAVGKSGTEAARNALVAHWSEEVDYRVRCNILRAMANFSYEEVKDFMFLALDDPDLPVAKTAANYFLQEGIAADARSYWIKTRDSLHWEVQMPLYAAANRHLPNTYSTTKGSINAELRRRFTASTDPYERAAVILAMGEFGWNYRFIKEQAFPVDEEVVRTASIQAIGRALAMDDYRSYYGPGYRTVRLEFRDILVEAIENGDPGMMAEAAEIMRRPNLFFKRTLDSLDFLENAIRQLELPKEVEIYDQLNRTLSFLQEEPEPAPYETSFNHPIDWELLTALPSEPVATIKTTAGEIQIRLYPLQAPGSVANFIQLAQSDFFDSLTFHRVVPNFVIQGGCPRGDGYGAMDYSIRTEISDLVYHREGMVGMASAGMHTEGTQFFITHSPTPHLDGGYTIFAEVITGMEVVHSVSTGTIILDVTLDWE